MKRMGLERKGEQVVISMLVTEIVIMSVWFAGLAQGAAPMVVKGTEPGGAVRRQALQMLEGSSAAMIENHGQWTDEAIRFAFSGRKINIGLTEEGLQIQLFEAEQGASEPSAKMAGSSLRAKNMGTRRKTFTMRFEGARRVQPVGRDKSSRVFHFRRGERAQWRENVPAWESVVYEGLYEGIDLVIKSQPGGLKYEFRVAPGANWKQIRMGYEGIEGLALKADGSLAIEPGEGWAALADGAPFIYQEDAKGSRQEVTGRFKLIDARTLGFELTGPCDSAQPLVIDPNLVAVAYFGENQYDYANDIAVDNKGNIYVIGQTLSSGWVSGMDPSLSDTEDAFVIKLSTTGGASWTAYLGGTGVEYGESIAVDGDGNIYAKGTTTNADWVGESIVHIFNLRMFVVKLSPAGQHLWSICLVGALRNDTTYQALGGGGGGIAVDQSGNAYVTGRIRSPASWVSGGYNTSGGSGFVAKLSPTGSHLWATYLGGPGSDITVDKTGNVYVTGETVLPGWVSGGYDTIYNDGVLIPSQEDGFVVKLSNTGQHLWSTYLGGDGSDFGHRLAVDSGGDVYVTGLTILRVNDWVSGGYNVGNDNKNDAYKGFVVKLSNTGRHLWSTYLGGMFNYSWGYDSGEAIAVDKLGDAYVTGSTNSPDWVEGGFNVRFRDNAVDAFVVKLSPAGKHRWSTYLGLEHDGIGSGIAVDNKGNIFLAGTKYPAVGPTDAFLAAITQENAVPAEEWTLY